MPTYKQVVNHVKKHVLWKEEYFERYYRLNPELVQKRLDKIYQAKDDLMVLISTQLFCFLQANGTLYFDGCYKTGKADNSLLCTNLALWSIELACDHFDIREERGHTTKFSEQGESWLTLFACNQFSLVPYCYPAIQRGFQSGVLKEIVPFYREQKLGILAMEIMARERGDTINWEAMQVRVDPVYLDFCQKPVEGGIGEQNAIQPQFLMPVRIMPDFDTVVVAAINLYQLASTRPPVTRLMNFRRALSARDPDSGFYHEASDSFLAKNQTVNFLQIFQRQRGAKITVVLPDYTECLIYQ